MRVPALPDAVGHRLLRGGVTAGGTAAPGPPSTPAPSPPPPPPRAAAAAAAIAALPPPPPSPPRPHDDRIGANLAAFLVGSDAGCVGNVLRLLRHLELRTARRLRSAARRS